MKNRYYDERDYEYGDEMLNVVTDCNGFSSRRDVSSFNMTDYRSCENCRHMTADYRCSLGKDMGFPRWM